MHDFTGHIVDLQRDYRTSKPMLKLILNEDAEGLFELGEAELCIKLSRKKEHRSLDSNAYFHVMCDKLRRKLKVSMPRMKNILIGRYGQLLYIDGIVQEFASKIPPDYMLEQESMHFWPAGITIQNGEALTLYRLYRGSHTYDTKEMSELIDGTVQECKEQGIETATPDQLKEFAALWESRYNKRRNKGIG